MLCCSGSFENAGQDPLKKPQKSNTSSVEVSSDAQLSDVEIALRKVLSCLFLFRRVLVFSHM